MKCSGSAILNNFLRVYEKPIPFIPQTRRFVLTLIAEPSGIGPVPYVPPYNPFNPSYFSTNNVVTGSPQGPTGPYGKAGNKFSSITQFPVLITPTSGIVMLEVGKDLSYIYGTPVYVSSAETYTNNFSGTILAYDSYTGYMTIGDITSINGSFGETDMYTVNAQYLINISPQGPQGVENNSGLTGEIGPTGPTGPQVPFSGGTTAIIALALFQLGFDCGDVYD
jgi:hypothetical protein